MITIKTRYPRNQVSVFTTGEQKEIKKRYQNSVNHYFCK
jgi:hypothetical protein